MSQEARMNMDEFKSAPRGGRKGTTAWLVSLPKHVPMLAPDWMFDEGLENREAFRRAAMRLHASARPKGISILTKTINGRLWVVRTD